MIRNWYNQIPYSALKTKREITKYINWQQFTKGTRGKPNEQLFPRQVAIQLPKYVTHIIDEGLDGGVWNSLISKNLAHYLFSFFKIFAYSLKIINFIL